MDYSYLMSDEERFVVGVLEAYKTNHADAFKGISTRTNNADGSISIHLEVGKLEEVLTVALKEYARMSESVNPELSGALEALDAHEFIMKRHTKDYHGDFFSYIGAKM